MNAVVIKKDEIINLKIFCMNLCQSIAEVFS